MRSGLTHVGQILRADPGSLSEDDRRLLYATMSDSRYQKAWKSSPRRQKPRSQLLRPQRQPQLHQDQDQDEAYDQHQQGEFASVEEVTEELLKVVEQQKQHLLAAVECEVRIKELWWYRHAMEEKGKEKEKEKEGGD
nr:uncharacterized protein CTRU02_14211 [Colletotrichum truncatum]KAF6782434.1 hypothetical protein CTRU02_14211 [Colletotrichum truncatum]